LKATTSAIAFALGLSVALASCSDASEEGDTTLDRYLCTSEDLVTEFNQQVAGSFSATDLGSLGDGTEERKQAYREAGLERGRFVFWKELLPRPPFDPPVNVVCQVLVFGTPQQAMAWVANLEADADEIGASGIVWLPDGERSVEDLGSDETGRTFRVVAEEGDARVSLWATYSVRGNLVLSVFAGDREGRLGFAVVSEIQAARDARLNGD